MIYVLLGKQGYLPIVSELSSFTKETIHLLHEFSYHPQAQYICLASHPEERKHLIKTYSHLPWITLIHPNTPIPPSVHVGKGVLIDSSIIKEHCILEDHSILLSTTLGNDVYIGKNVILHPSCLVYDNVTILDNSTIQAHSIITSYATVEKDTHLATGTTFICS